MNELHAAKIASSNIAKLSSAIREEVQYVLPILKDRSLPLDERWSVFLDVAEFLPNDRYGDGHIDTLDSSRNMYDYFYMDRHQTESYKDFWEHLQERVDEDVDLGWDLREWREKVLAAGYGSFTYDW